MPGLQLRFMMVLPGLAALLAGCSSLPSSVNPVAWWHNLQGGAIAEQRPPPPGATDPFPNLSTVPGKPPPGSPAARQQIAQALVADRTNAQHAAEADPLPDPSSQAASPALFGQGTSAPPAPPGAASASLEAANAPPAPPPSAQASEATPTIPQAAPATGGGAGPAAAPKPSGAPADVGPRGAAGTPALAPPGAVGTPAAAPDLGPLPALAAVPPSSPDLPGAPSSRVRPAAPRTPPAGGAATAKTTPSVEPVAVAFAGGSAVLPTSGSASLRQFAAKRGGARVAVTGFGEAASNDPDAQSAALTLGLQRAKAMAAALTQAGVPAASVRIDAEASGRGGAARLID